MWKLPWHLQLTKILISVNLNQILWLSEDILPEDYCSFRLCYKVHMVFAVKKFQEKYRAQNSDLYFVFADLQQPVGFL